MSYYKKLFEPASIGKLQLKNRISMAPMGPIGCGCKRRIQTADSTSVSRITMWREQITTWGLLSPASAL